MAWGLSQAGFQAHSPPQLCAFVHRTTCRRTLWSGPDQLHLEMEKISGPISVFTLAEFLPEGLSSFEHTTLTIQFSSVA